MYPQEEEAVEDSVSFRRSLWFSALIAAVILAALIGVSTLVPRPTNPVILVAVGLVLALVPALVWTAFFKQMDREEPEPNRLIARAFAFGALAAAALAIPFASYVASQTLINYPDLIPRILLTILSISLMQEVLKLAMVRYVVLGTDEFDRHPDGIVYGLATGIGFATVLTVEYILRVGGVVPQAGAIIAVENALVHGALGAVTGYYIGRVKIDGKSVPWLFTGLGAVTIVNGLYQVARNELSAQLSYNPWVELVIAAALAAVAGASLILLFRRAMQRATGDLQTVSIQAHARDKEMPWDIALRYDGVIVLAALIALVVGVGAGLLARGRVAAYDGADLGVSLQYPARWSTESRGDSGHFAARDWTAGGVFKPSITLERTKIAESADSELELDRLAALEAIRLDETYLSFAEVEDRRTVDVNGQRGIQLRYQYATEDDGRPALRAGVVTLVSVGDYVYSIRYEAEPEHFETDLPDYETVLNTVRFTGAQ